MLVGSLEILRQRSGIVVEGFGTLRWLSGIMGAGFQDSEVFLDKREGV